MPSFSDISQTIQLLATLGVFVMFFTKRYSNAEVNQAEQTRLSKDFNTLSDTCERLESAVNALTVQLARQETRLDFYMNPTHRSHVS